MRTACIVVVVCALAITLSHLKARSVAPSFLVAVEAACDGNPDLLRYQLARGVNVNQRQENGLTLLMCAACLGQNECVRALIQCGADVDARTPRGWTALMMAATNGHEHAARLLLRAGANPGLASECGTTAREIAQERGAWDLLDLIAEHVSVRGETIPVALEPVNAVTAE